MRQELIDLYLGELEDDAADALRARIREDEALAREYAEVAAICAFMGRGEEIEPSPAKRAELFAEIARLSRPTLWEQLRQLPGLVRYRFVRSVAFRVAAVSLGVHLIAMAVLFKVYVTPRAATGPGSTYGFVNKNPGIHEPEQDFVARLQLRQTPHLFRLRQYGIGGQAEAIRTGLQTLVDSQRADGSFGDVSDTAYGALALLAEGECSAHGTRRGFALERAIHHLLVKARVGARHGAVLAALVEDYGLSYESLSAEERRLYTRVIYDLIGQVDDDDAGHEGLALAKLAGFQLPEGRSLGRAAVLLEGDRAALLAERPTRLTVSAMLAKGPLSADRERVRTWARPFFEAALAEIEAGRVTGEALLALQAPYRL
jgi:hypothetical protein